MLKFWPHTKVYTNVLRNLTDTNEKHKNKSGNFQTETTLINDVYQLFFIHSTINESYAQKLQNLIWKSSRENVQSVN